MTDRTAELSKKLTWAVEAALNIRKKIAEDLLKSNCDAEYQLRWLEGHYKTVKIGQIAEYAVNDGIVAALRYAHAQLECWRPQRSTSAYSNTCNDEAYDAYKQFIQDFGRFVTVDVKPE